jgi:hypothetical protein
MGFAGSSLHVSRCDQRIVADRIIGALAISRFAIECDCSLAQLPAYDRKLFRSSTAFLPCGDWINPHGTRPNRAFVLSPRIDNWVSIFEYGEYFDLDLAQLLSQELHERVAATLWEEHVGTQIINVYRDGKITDHFSDQGDGISFSSGGELATANRDEFILEYYVEGQLGIRLAYGLSFGDVLLNQEMWAETCSLDAFRYLKFSKTPQTVN